MDRKIVISAQNLKKHYFISKGLFSFLQKKEKNNIITVLNGINLEIDKGEILGIIGQNGSGKSTLLKVLSGVTSPSGGKAIINGKIVSAIEVAGGFNPDLNALENIRLLGRIWGVSTKEIHKLESDIINFSRLKEFIYLPVKKFSTGMVGRLAASIIIYIKADIYLFDEVLNGSDQLFKRQLHNKILNLQSNGSTILFATHNATDVLALCNRVILIDSGKIIFNGNAFKGIIQYRKLIQADLSKLILSQPIVNINNVKSNNISFNHIKMISTGECHQLSLTLLAAPGFYSQGTVHIIINNAFDIPVGHTSFFMEKIPEKCNLSCNFPLTLLTDGIYTISLAASLIPEKWMFFPRILEFEIKTNIKQQNDFIPGISLTQAKWNISC